MRPTRILPIAVAAACLVASHPALGAPAKSKASSVGSKRPSVLAFIEDDYARALAVARAKKIPIFIDAWAPW